MERVILFIIWFVTQIWSDWARKSSVEAGASRPSAGARNAPELSQTDDNAIHVAV